MSRTSPRTHLSAAVLAVVAGLLGAAAATAQVDAALVDELLDRSGLTVQLGQIAEAFQDQTEAGDLEAELPADVHQRLVDAAGVAFGSGRLRAGVGKHLATALSEQEIREVLEWLSSPLGERITRLEEVAPTPESTAAKQRLEETYESEVKRRRRERFTRLDEAAQVSESVLVLETGTMVGLLEGIRLVAPQLVPMSKDALMARAEEQREARLERARRSVLAGFAYTYRDLSDREIERYIAFAESGAGQKYHAAVNDALEGVLGEGARELGFLLAPSARDL